MADRVVTHALLRDNGANARVANNIMTMLSNSTLSAEVVKRVDQRGLYWVKHYDLDEVLDYVTPRKQMWFYEEMMDILERIENNE